MTDAKPKTAREMSPEEYRAAVDQIRRDARKAEGEAEQARVQRAVEAKFAKKDAKR